MGRRAGFRSTAGRRGVAGRRRGGRALPLLAAALLAGAPAGCREEEPPRTRLRSPAAAGEAREPLPGTPERPLVATLDEWRVYIDPHDVDAGRHEFLVVNAGIYEHAFVVEGRGRQWRTPNIVPGGQARLAVDLAPGIYVLYCPIEDEHGDHSEMGMRTTLEVGEE